MSIFLTTMLLATAQRSSPDGARSQKRDSIGRCTSSYQRLETTHALSQGSVSCYGGRCRASGVGEGLSSIH